MAEQNKIPSGKVQRAGKFIKTSVIVGANYASHYMKKAVNIEVNTEDLDKKNAESIFNALSQLKGSALKIAQMLSMDTGILPKAYAEKFAAAQNNALSLSSPMVLNTFIKNMGKKPSEIYDSFNTSASFAASIGQVHEANLNGEKLAVKIQYPGVAESIKSDINLVKPLILKLVGISNEVVMPYVDEIEARLIEETDYNLELQNGLDMMEVAKNFDNIITPKYYKDLSNNRILTMSWLEGISLTTFIEEEKNKEKRTKIGQALLDFVHYQIHTKKKFHADLHPGNFLITADGKLGVLDFGCMKSLPLDFYTNYFSLIKPEVLDDDVKLRKVLEKLDMLRPLDTPEEDALFFEIAKKSIAIVSKPMMVEEFYFGDKQFAADLFQYGESLAGNKSLRNDSSIRGSKHGIYLHRTFMGLFSILLKLDVTLKIDRNFISKL